MSGLTVKDLAKIQIQLPDYRIELVGGEVIIMSPSGYESDEVAFEFGRQLANWTKPHQLGRVTGSSAGFTLPNSDTRAPNVSFFCTRQPTAAQPPQLCRLSTRSERRS